MDKLKVIISGGGTGGHVFPAIAIANALKKLNPNVEILFVGAKDKMEMQKVPEAGYKIEGLWISGFQRRLTTKNLVFPFKVIASLLKSKKIIKQFQPDVVIGVGGYSSGPVVYVASKMGIPTLVQEQNSFPGITNRILAKKVDKICVAYDGMERFFPKLSLIKTGNPVRRSLLDINIDKTAAYDRFNLDPNKKTLLVIGGSLGARTINESIKEGLRALMDLGIQVLWQTGKNYFNEAESAARKIDLNNIVVREFIKEMDLAYAVADVVVSRAGAISVSELCLAKKPVIFVPSPNVAEDHQTKNATALVNNNAAILVKDKEAGIMLVNKVKELLKNQSLQDQLTSNIAKLGISNAAEVIAQEVFDMVSAE
ncbi:MAG: undecaprenyldiphospho-muramoylpentapeptide beta-N-acetylglucosaminyltransferase [Bacteroidia bacterium]|nr:undecaprenyldiphospho-muramoylpentapeptide beta-N-acetylglucosaminyltransferase [Bacteroidia bacterium]